MFELQGKIVSLIEQDQHEQALEYLDQYLNKYGKDDFYYLAISDVLYGMELYDQVIDMMHQCMDAGYESSIVFERLADAYIAKEDYDSALLWLKQCDFGTDNEEGLHNLFSLGVCYMQKEDYKRAVSYFEDVLLDSDSLQATLKAGMCYWNLGKQKRALEYFDKCLVDQDTLKEVCLFLSVQDDYDVLEHYLSYLNNRDFALLHEIEFHIYHHNHQKAVNLLLELLENDQNVYLYTILADTYQQMNESALAQTYYRKAIHTENEMENQADHIIGLYLYALNHTNYSVTTTRKYLKKYLNRYPNNPDVYFQVIQFLFRNQDFSYLNYLLCQQEHPAFYNLEDEYRFVYFQVESCLYVDHYEQAYKILKKYPERKDKLYQKQLAVVSFYTKRFNECIDLSVPLLPDGLLASLLIFIFNEYEDEETKKSLIDFMSKAMQTEENIEDIEVYKTVLKEENTLE